MRKRLIWIICLSLLFCLIVFSACSNDKSYKTNVQEYKGGNVLTYPEAYAFTYYLIEKYGFNNVLNCCINYNFDGVFSSNYNVIMDEFMKSIE